MWVNRLTTQISSQLERTDSLQPLEPDTPPTAEDFPSTPHIFSVCLRCPDPKPSSSWKSIPHVRRGDAKALLQKVLFHSLVPFSSSPDSSTEGWKWSHKMTQSHFSPPLLTPPASFSYPFSPQMVYHSGVPIFQRHLKPWEDITHHKYWSGNRLLSQINVSQ